MKNNVWRGVLIEESLLDSSILSKMTIISTKTTTLEGESNRGEFHFHNVEVSPDNFNDVVSSISSHLIQKGWYFHLVKENELVVIFHNLILKAHKGNEEEFKKIRNYALSQAILAEQLPLEDLIHNPYL